jgi:hypothetical protein
MEKINKFDQIIYCTNITFNKIIAKCLNKLKRFYFNFSTVIHGQPFRIVH